MVPVVGFPPTLPKEPAPKAGASGSFATRGLTMAYRLGAAPSGAGFGDLRALAGARHVCDCRGSHPDLLTGNQVLCS